MSEEKILEFEAPIYFKYSYTAGKTTTSFLNSIKKENWSVKNVQSVEEYTYPQEVHALRME